jgi:hypothetical protein
MIVPVVGNFGGLEALRVNGCGLWQKEAVVLASHTSTLEQYLHQDGTWPKLLRERRDIPRRPQAPSSVRSAVDLAAPASAPALLQVASLLVLLR